MNVNQPQSAEDIVPIADPLANLEKRWDQVQRLRLSFAKELTRLANEMYGEERRQLKCWSDWFRNETELEDALKRPDILAITLPILNNHHADELSAADVSRIAYKSLALLSVNPSIGRRALRILRYPLLVVFAFGLLWLGFIVWLAPVVRQTFGDFEIEFPTVTQAVLGISPELHAASWLVAAASVIAFLLVNYQLRKDRRRAPNSGWLDRRLMSNRGAVGAWAWHVALLMQAGLNAFDSAKMAGLVSGNRWVKSESLAWTSASRARGDTSRVTTSANASVFTSSPFRFVSKTMQLPDSEFKTTLLQQAAKYYLDRDSGVSYWWFRLLASLILWNVGVVCIVFFIAVYGNIFSTCRSLMGFGW